MKLRIQTNQQPSFSDTYTNPTPMEISPTTDTKPSSDLGMSAYNQQLYDITMQQEPDLEK